MIGPYCQLTAAHGVALVAGNLGLHPASMTLVPGGTDAQVRVRVRLRVRVRVRVS